MSVTRPERASNFTAPKPVTVEDSKKETSIVDELLQLTQRNSSYYTNFTSRLEALKNEDKEKNKSSEGLNANKLFPGKQKITVRTTPRTSQTIAV